MRGTLALAGFLFALLAGCSDKATPEVPVARADNTEQDKKLPPSTEKGDQEKELADLDRQIAAKEKELAALRTKADALRSAIDKRKNPSGNVYKSPDKLFAAPAELLADLPKDSYPKRGDKFGAERKLANDWLKAHRIGRKIEWKATVEVKTKESGEHLAVWLSPKGKLSKGLFDSFLFWGEPVVLGEEKWQTGILYSYWAKSSPFAFEPVTVATAKEMREWDGKEVILRATLTGAKFDLHIGDKGDQQSYLLLDIASVTIHGYSPPIIKGQ